MNYPTDRYDAFARTLHWLMALMIWSRTVHGGTATRGCAASAAISAA